MTYEQWLKKYYKPAEKITVFKRIDGKGFITERQAKMRHKKAFGVSKEIDCDY